MTVSVPEDVIQEKMAERMKSLAREVKLDGFRPGKVPLHVIKKMFGSRVRSEITGDLIQTSYFEALKEQEQSPVGPPSIVPVDQQEEGGGIEYTAEFEVYPEISLQDVSQLEVTKETAEIAESDLENMIQKLRDQQKTWEMVERAAQQEDRVKISFSGTVDGEDFTDGKVEDYTVVIGDKQMIPGFEEELVGLAAGDNKTFSITFPEDYKNEKLAGKLTEFNVGLDQIEEAMLPEIDEEFIKNYGIDDGDMQRFREDVQANMQRELAQASRGKLKNQVMDQLFENIPVELPSALVDQEVENVMKPYKENAARQNTKLEDLELPQDQFASQAKRRVALGLILAEVIKKHDIKIDNEKVSAFISEMAQSYERPQDVIDWYKADETRLNEVQQMVMEEQAVDWLLNQITVTEKSVSFDELMQQSDAHE